VILRLRHECGRNLADVTEKKDYRKAGAPDLLWVTPRPNVKQDQHRPNLSLVSGITYTWRCRCGQILQRRHERIAAAWAEHDDGDRRVVVIVVGRDL
jgi:hypothetical protein